MSPTAPLATVRLALAKVLPHTLPQLTVNTVIALGLTTFGKGDFGVNLLVSHCIGISIWLTMELALHWFIPQREKQWRRLFWVVPLAVTLGFVFGYNLAAWILDQPLSVAWIKEPSRMAGYLLMSLVAGGGLTYYFLSREQLARAREEMALSAAQAEAAQRHATEAQLKLLETQLEPHMLFNTLANLRALIGVDARRAQDMLDRLVAYLRATLAASRANTFSLGAEFERLNDYLELMRVRMGTRLQFKLDLPAALSGYQIPPLLLQALVENSIKHGLEPSVQGGRIDIRAQREGQSLVLQVQDSGVGLGTGVPSGNPANSGFGLGQVRDRLQASYGPLASLTIADAPGGGTLATVTMPIAA